MKTATITFSGALAGVGTTRAFATTTFTGDLASVGTTQEFATSTFTKGNKCTSKAGFKREVGKIPKEEKTLRPSLWHAK